MANRSPVDDILSFWFAPETKARWFEPDPAFDATCRLHFEPWIDEAASGRLDGWAMDPHGALAIVILLDQLPRNIWRGTPRAFAFDPQARATADRALGHGFDQELSIDERAFLYLPFEHSEDLADQDRAVALFEALGDATYLDYARRHRAVIARFGRFPHRNVILGRESTPDEVDFLKEPGSSF